MQPAATAYHDDDTIRDRYAKCVRLVERAILTGSVLPDQEARFIYGNGSFWPEFRRELTDYLPDAKRPRFRPTARDVSNFLPVYQWLTWLSKQNDGKRDMRIITAYAFGASYYKIGLQIGRSPDTASRWHRGALMAISNRYWREVDDMAE